MIVAGEASGDLHGSALIKSLKKKTDLNFLGIGGDKMIAEGMKCLFHIKDMAFMGFAEIVRHLPFIKRVQRKLIDEIIESKIETVILIDYPGFNLNFARKVKKLGVKIIYYISPQIWAWGIHRIKKIQKLVDKMLVLFPFEKDFYQKYNIDAEYVGHPLIERFEVYPFLSREQLFDKFNLDMDKNILLLMPGSREQEVKRIFPETIKAAKELAKKFNLQIVVLSPDNINSNLYSEHTQEDGFTVVGKNNYDFLKHSKLGIIKSGTSTLEAGLLGLPMVVVYSTSNLSYLIGKTLATIENIAMINIIAGKNIVTELIQGDANKNKIYQVCSELLENNEKYTAMRQNLLAVKNHFGNYKASENAANEIINFLGYEKP